MRNTDLFTSENPHYIDYYRTITREVPVDKIRSETRFPKFTQLIKSEFFVWDSLIVVKIRIHLISTLCPSKMKEVRTWWKFQVLSLTSRLTQNNLLWFYRKVVWGDSLPIYVIASYTQVNSIKFRVRWIKIILLITGYLLGKFISLILIHVKSQLDFYNKVVVN